MSGRLAHARTQSAALDWVANSDPSHPDSALARTIDAAKELGFTTGAEWADGELAAELAKAEERIEQQARWLRMAEVLMIDAAMLLREYQLHRLGQCIDKVNRDPRDEEHRRAAGNSGATFVRLQAWIEGAEVPQDPLIGLALSLVQDLGGLISESGGVYGLHLNGDTCPWSDLIAGGANEEWLGSYDRLKEALDARFPVGRPAEISPVEADPLRDRSINPAEALRVIAGTMVDGERIVGVDHESFDKAAAMLDAPADPAAVDNLRAMLAEPDEFILPPGGFEAGDKSGDRFGNVPNFGGGTSNVRPTTGPWADQTNIAGLAGMIDRIGGPAKALTAIGPVGLEIRTPDPRFDPCQPVTINGYRYEPTTENL